LNLDGGRPVMSERASERETETERKREREREREREKGREREKEGEVEKEVNARCVVYSKACTRCEIFRKTEVENARIRELDVSTRARARASVCSFNCI